MWIALVLAVVLVAITVAAVLGRVDGSLADPTSSLSYVPLPGDRITPEDVAALRLDTGLRGYRMEQVDEVIDRLADEIVALRQQVALLQPPAPDPFEPPAPTDQQTTEQEPTEQELTEQELTEQEPTEQEPTGAEPGSEPPAEH